ncbi:MAG: cysteine desulfurase family protein [Patescibacteria group bacterium]
MKKIFTKKRKIYLDHAATTYVDRKVFISMLPFFSEKFANPSAIYSAGVEIEQIIKKNKKDLAEIFHATPDSFLFTSGGTESINLAILGTARANKKFGNHIITTAIEHPAVLNSVKALAKEGFEITYLKPDEYGFISAKQIKEALKSETILVSIMMANNEIGTVEPIAEIGKEILKWRKDKKTIYPYFHSDACQAAGFFDLDVEKSHVDLLSLNAGKIYGPKGSGLLYKRKDVKIEAIIFGGGQQTGLRSGTENVAGIIGLAEALKIAQENRKKETLRLFELRNYFFKKIQEKIKDVKLNGPELNDPNSRLVNNLNVSFLGIEGEALLLYLDAKGIMCSTGSACSSQSLAVSHVLDACGFDFLRMHSSIRFSLGKINNKKDIDYVIKYLPELVEKLRKISSISNNSIKEKK